MKYPQRIIPFLMLCFIFQSLVFSQDKKQEKKGAAQTQSQALVAPAAPRPPLAFGLSEDTPVKLKLSRTMSSADASPNEKVDFEVLEDVKIGDLVVIRQGSTAIGTVTQAQPKRRMGKGGKLDMNIDYVLLVDGGKAPLRAVKGGSGGNHTGAVTGAIVATSILFFPAAPFFLFMHGKDITIPKGTEITAYIAGDTPLDPEKFKASATNLEAAPLSTASNVTAVIIKSSPDGADITIDGKFVGNTPSSLKLTPGEHTIRIDKAGFKSWQRTLTVTIGSEARIEATLDKTPGLNN